MAGTPDSIERTLDAASIFIRDPHNMLQLPTARVGLFVLSFALLLSTLSLPDSAISSTLRSTARAARWLPSVRESAFSPSAARSPDYLDAASDEGVYQWPQSKLPLKVYMTPGNSVPGYRSDYPEILSASFDEWVKASDYRLSWVRVYDRSKADVVVTWTTDTPELQGGTEAGLTRCYAAFDTETNHGLIHRATMSLATEMPDRQLSDREIKRAYLHEVGHAFGIAGHSPHRADIMYGAIGRGQQPVLSEADVATINRLYTDYPVNNETAMHPRGAVSQQGGKV